MRRLPDTELEVMQAVWACDPPVTRAEIEQILSVRHPMAQTTLLTFLSRLTEKGFLRTEKNGRISLYYPLIEKNEYAAVQSKQFVRQHFGESISAFRMPCAAAG